MNMYKLLLFCLIIFCILIVHKTDQLVQLLPNVPWKLSILNILHFITWWSIVWGNIAFNNGVTGDDQVMMASIAGWQHFEKSIWPIDSIQICKHWLSHPPWPAGWRRGPCPPCPRAPPAPACWGSSVSAAGARPCDPGAGAQAAPPRDGCQTDQWRTGSQWRTACPLEHKLREYEKLVFVFWLFAVLFFYWSHINICWGTWGVIFRLL